MKWTDKPTEPGWYWMKGGGLTELCVGQLKVYRDKLCWDDEYYNEYVPIDELEFEFYGPLTPPEEE